MSQCHCTKSLLRRNRHKRVEVPRSDSTEQKLHQCSQSNLSQLRGPPKGLISHWNVNKDITARKSRAKKNHPQTEQLKRFLKRINAHCLKPKYAQTGQKATYRIPYIFIFNVMVVLNPCARLLGQMDGAIFPKNTSSSSQTHLRPWRQLTGDTSREVFPDSFINSLHKYESRQAIPKPDMMCLTAFFFCRCLTRSPLCPHQEASLSNTAHSLSDLSSRLSYSERWEMS